MKNLKKIMLVLVLTVMVGFIPSVKAMAPSASSLDNLPELITVDASEEDYSNNWEEIYNTINKQITDLLETDGVELGDNYKISTSIEINTDGKDYHNLSVILDEKVDENGYSNLARKTIKMRFSNTASYAALRGDINSKLTTLSNKTFYYLGSSEDEIVSKLENGIYTSKVDAFFTNKLKKQFNNNSIEVHLNTGVGSTTVPGEEPEDITMTLKEYREMTEIMNHKGRMSLYVYKDNVFLGETEIILKLGVGYSNGTESVLMNNIDSNDNNYVEMKNVLSKKGYSNIIKAYELTLVEGTINGKLSVSIPVGAEYNGKEVVILHKKADGSYEEFTTTVKDGNASIEVTELSPFMIALKDSSNVTKLSNNAQTSSMNIVLLSILSVLSLSGIIYLVIRNKKVA